MVSVCSVEIFFLMLHFWRRVNATRIKINYGWESFYPHISEVSWLNFVNIHACCTILLVRIFDSHLSHLSYMSRKVTMSTLKKVHYKICKDDIAFS
ncbi:hypothetical protein HanRHA438_Chr01g0033261 [Helianthus annuus]|nr:hypothetical protein HanRHA438_Chr01g0033261 [Helianthus annuus]